MKESRIRWKKALKEFEQWYARVGIKKRPLDWGWDWSLIENFALQYMYKEEICLDIGCGNGWFLIRVAKKRH